MKRSNNALRLVNYLLMVACLFTLYSCPDNGGGGTPTPTVEEERIEVLTGNSSKIWRTSSITFEGAPATGFDNFSLTLASNKTYSSTDGDPLFNTSGSWDFNGSNLNTNARSMWKYYP